MCSSHGDGERQSLTFWRHNGRKSVHVVFLSKNTYRLRKMPQHNQNVKLPERGLVDLISRVERRCLWKTFESAGQITNSRGQLVTAVHLYDAK